LTFIFEGKKIKGDKDKKFDH